MLKNRGAGDLGVPFTGTTPNHLPAYDNGALCQDRPWPHIERKRTPSRGYEQFGKAPSSFSPYAYLRYAKTKNPELHCV